MNQKEILIRVDKLVDIASENPRDISFIQDHLTRSNRVLFNELIKEKKIKPKKPKRQQAVHLGNSYMLTVFDEAQFAAELALSLSKSYGNKKIAILDSDRFNPSLDIYLNANSHIKSVFTHLDFRRATGLNLLIDANKKHVLTKNYVDHLSIKVNGYKNLSYFSGSYLIEDYEYYKLDDYKKILRFLKLHYDVLIVSVNKFIYDAFTCQSLITSDYNMISLRGSMPHVNERRKYIEFLVNKQKIDYRKNKYLLFDYSPNNQIKEKLIKELVKGHYLGHIPYSPYRNKGVYRSYPFTRHFRKRNMTPYIKLFNQLGKDEQ